MDNIKRKNIGKFISLVIHILLIILLLLPLLQKAEKEDPQGILIAFGDPDAGMQDEAPLDQNSNEAASQSKPVSGSSKPENIQSESREDEAPVKANEKKDNKQQKTDVKKPNTNTEEEQRKKAEADRIARENEERIKAEKEAQERANQKKKYSDLFGKGQGNNNNSGNQGTEKGSPDGKALEGISKGSGRVGGGLAGRGIEYEPSFSDNSQKTGKVNLSICVDENGKVVKAEFTQRGSTTSDSYLIELAKRSALKYKFSKSENEMQCGTVLIDFRVK